MDYLLILDYLGIAVFAATGALAASRKQLDIIGFIFFAAITGIGGGTLRDVLLGKLPVFWIHDPRFLAICATTAIIIFFIAHTIEYRYRLLLWLDAIGMSAYCVMGTIIGIEQGISPYASIVMGVMTATFGGIFRDILSNETSVLLRDEIYITAALLGAFAYVTLSFTGLEHVLVVVISILLAFLLRASALLFGLTLPRYKPRQGRKNQ